MAGSKSYGFEWVLWLLLLIIIIIWLFEF